MVGIGHDRALGDLQRQSAGLHPVGRDGLGHLPRERVVEQAAAGDVDSDREVDAGGLPLVALSQGRAEDIADQRLDETGTLSQRDEITRREQPIFRVLPAHQRLDSLDPLGLQIHLRLVEEHQLAAFEAAAELTE
jgi:hypothetical protein